MFKSIHKSTAVLLAFCLCLPLFSVFAAEESTVTFDGETYRGTDAALPYFYTTSESGATLTDCLPFVSGDAVLPETLGGVPLTAIAEGAFDGCDNLTSLFLPKSVTEISDGALPAPDAIRLYGEIPSFARTYAQENGYSFSVPFLIGDADESGALGATDVSTLAQALSGWDMEYSKKAADFTQDFKLSANDIAALAKELAGWNPPTLFVLGDETVSDPVFDGYYPAAGYGDYLAERLSWHPTELLTETGASAKNTLSHQNYLSLFNQLKSGDHVLLSFGIHDAASLASSYAPAAGDHTTAGSFSYYLYEYYVKPILARGATPVLVTPVVERPTDGETFTESTLRLGYPAALRALATAEDLPLIDLADASEDLYRKLGAEENAYLNAWKTKSADSLNAAFLSVFGAEQFAALIAEGLGELSSDFTVSEKDLDSPTVSAYLYTYRATPNQTVFTYSDGTTSTTTDTTVTADSYSVPEGETLVSVSLAEGVLAIADKAFFAQYDLETLGMTLPSTLETIGSFAFHSCNSLRLDAFPDSLFSIGDSAFYGCESITVSALGSGITHLGDYAFYGCDSIPSMTFDASLYTVPKSAFRTCRSLKSFTLHEFVEELAPRALESCFLIKEITLPEGFTTLGRFALRKTGITELQLPASTLSLDEEALAECTELSNLYYPLVATEWVKIEKGVDWYRDTMLSVICCDDGDVTTEGVILVDYHAYYSDFFNAFSDANAGTTENADLTRHDKESAAAAILIDDGVLTLKLFEGVNLSSLLTMSGTYTLDLQGQNLVFNAAGAHFELAQDADVTVCDSVGGGKVYKAIDSSSAQYLYNLPNTGSRLTIHGGNHTCTNELGSSIVVRGMGKENSAFTMTDGVLSANAGDPGNAKAVQAPATTEITGGALASKTVSGNSYTVSGSGSFTIRGGTFDSYTKYGNSMALFVGGNGASHVDIYDGAFTTHASAINGKHIAFSTASDANAVIYGGTFTVDSKKTGDAGACGIATAGPSLVIHDAYAQGNSAGMQALGVNTTVYGGTFVGSDHGGAYFGHNGDIGEIRIFGGTYRFLQPDWQASTSGTGSAYITGGGKVYIDSATFEGRIVAISSIAGESPATEIYISRTTAPSWRVDSMHDVYFGKDMGGAITSGGGTVDFETFADIAFDESYVTSLA